MSDIEFEKFSDRCIVGNISISQFFDFVDFDALSRNQIDEVVVKIYNQCIDAKNQLQPLIDQVSSLNSLAKEKDDISDLKNQIIHLNEENSKLSKLLSESISDSSEKIRIVKVKDKSLFFSGMAYAKQIEKNS